MVEITAIAPKTLKLPLFEYGTIGSFDYFVAHLKSIAHMENLCSEIFQSFREIGNCFVMVKMIDDIMVRSQSIIDRCRHYFSPIVSTQKKQTRIQSQFSNYLQPKSNQIYLKAQNSHQVITH